MPLARSGFALDMTARHFAALGYVASRIWFEEREQHEFGEITLSGPVYKGGGVRDYLAVRSRVYEIKSHDRILRNTTGITRTCDALREPGRRTMEIALAQLNSIADGWLQSARD
ncbi:hypothetical protein NUW58_g10912 [Xylaria curta]|uniref:Uncharacterized protein n=1 Tax=Xylaria curta TaxID=42375 RepID=A0ACC1MFI6_9PEZI|nr:hypothetical protein NUW58_g10912 [Xylaria curta]